MVLLISIDQARAEYLTRFRPAFTGGLAYLLDNGAVFTDAHQNHSMTATAPGHATLATGLNPGRSGIVGNGWYDRERAEQIYSARRDDVTGPGWLMGTALGDWMKAADSRSKVFLGQRQRQIRRHIRRPEPQWRLLVQPGYRCLANELLLRTAAARLGPGVQ